MFNVGWDQLVSIAVASPRITGTTIIFFTNRFRRLQIFIKITKHPEKNVPKKVPNPRGQDPLRWVGAISDHFAYAD